ncbi:hypothetical protein MHU86_13130 [Fragilaria crotonensis]|nr:hypothetical protein MHU86_13130 [Fragilaria crotonensis]
MPTALTITFHFFLHYYLLTMSLVAQPRSNYAQLLADDELHKHAANGNVTKVKEALQQGANISSTDAGGNTALIAAVCCGYLHGGDDGGRVQRRSKSKE